MNEWRGEYELSQRVIRGDRALRCCELSAERAGAILVGVAAEIAVQAVVQQIVYVHQHVTLKGRTFAPGEIAAIPPTWEVPRDSMSIVLPAAEPLAGLFIQGVATQLASVLNSAANGIRTVFSREDGPCADCIRRGCLPQQPQKRREKTVRSRH